MASGRYYHHHHHHHNLYDLYHHYDYHYHHHHYCQPPLLIPHLKTNPFVRTTRIQPCSLEFKLQAIVDAEDTSKRAAAFKHKIDRKLLRTWVKSKDKLLGNESRHYKGIYLTHSNRIKFLSYIQYFFKYFNFFLNFFQIFFKFFFKNFKTFQKSKNFE